MWISCWNEDRQMKPKYSVKTLSIATLSIINLTSPRLASNPNCWGGKLVTKRLS
jgi:hypothetical protein